MMHRELKTILVHLRCRCAIVFLCVVVIAVFCGAAIASSPPDIDISNTPMALVEATHPQVLLVVPNSQSMDGNLSGAIMTGSGIVDDLNNSSSPEKYSVPPGFVPPKPGIDGDGKAPYTVRENGGYTLYDNSPSRLNVAKQAIRQVLEHYAANFDFGLMTYDTGSPTRHPTWVYYMSASGGFDFSNNKSSPLGDGEEWIANPCYQYENKSGIDNSCEDVDDEIAGDIGDKKYIAIAETSDAPYINDVGYLTNDWPEICLILEGSTPGSPFDYSLEQYNKGQVGLSYSHSTCSGSAITFDPTNAGYVPYDAQVLLAKRGFAYQSNQFNSKGDILVDIAPASTGGATTQTEIDAYIAKFSGYLKPETSDLDTDEIKALNGQSPMATLVKWARKYYTNGVSGHPKPTSNTGCLCDKYVVMLTDGLPTQDLDGDAWPPLGTAAAAGYKVHATFALEGGGSAKTSDSDFKAQVVEGIASAPELESLELVSTNDQALQDTIDELAELADAGVTTFIVGMGAGVDPSKNPAAAATMKAMAIAGGTDGYFRATSPQAVVDALKVIFSQIQAANQSSTTVATNSTSFQSNLSLYQARYDNKSYGWTGDLVSFPVDANGDVGAGNPNWHARALMATDFDDTDWNTGRIMITVDPSTGDVMPFRWADLTPSQQTVLETDWATLTGTEQDKFGNDKGTYGEAVLNYLRGDTTHEPTDADSDDGVFRYRKYLLGDIVHSAPLYVGAPPHGVLGDGYISFARSHADRPPVVYVGSNDGALHAFNADTGHEIFAFFPSASFEHLADTSLPTYNDNHRFFVDGSPNVGNAKFDDGSWHTVLAGGLNSGGKGIYALDVTNPSDFTSETAVASKVLWTITNNTPGFSHLGLTYSQPQIVKINCNAGLAGNCSSGDATYAAIFGSGYNNDNGKPYLYVVNVETGKLIRRFALCGEDSGQCDLNQANGLSTPVTILSNSGYTVDRAYAGDLQGHLWRIDLSDAAPSNWDAKVLFTARNGDGEVQSITTQPTAARAPLASNVAVPDSVDYGIMVYFGTGRYLGESDILDTRKQAFYGVLDTRSNADLNIKPGDLAVQTLAQTTVAGKSVRTATGDPIDWATQYGWRIPLPRAGERSITDPILASGIVIFTTFEPSVVVCDAGGTSRLMVLDYASGGAAAEPVLDLNGDGKFDNGDKSGSGDIAVGGLLGAGYAAAPTLVHFKGKTFIYITMTGKSGDYSIFPPPDNDPGDEGEAEGGKLNLPDPDGSTGVKSWSQIR